MKHADVTVWLRIRHQPPHNLKPSVLEDSLRPCQPMESPHTGSNIGSAPQMGGLSSAPPFNPTSARDYGHGREHNRTRACTRTRLLCTELYALLHTFAQAGMHAQKRAHTARTRTHGCKIPRTESDLLPESRLRHLIVPIPPQPWTGSIEIGPTQIACIYRVSESKKLVSTCATRSV